jgi:small conductance mechanosensitive channel
MSISVPGGWLDPLIILAVSVAFAVGCWFLLRGLALRRARLTRTSLDDAVIKSISGPLMALILLGGVYFAASYVVFGVELQITINKVLLGALTILGTWLAVSFIYALMGWYSREVGAKQSNLTVQFLQGFRWLVAVAGVLVGLMLVLDIAEVASGPVSWLTDHGWRIGLVLLLAILALMGVGWTLPRLIESAIGRHTGEVPEEARKRSQTLSRVAVNAGEVTTLIIGAFMVLSELGIDIAPVLAGLGVVGVAVGFGAQNLIRDLLSGTFVILENQYGVGDVASIGGVAGLVEDINLRRTVLRDLDGTVHVVPNGEIRVASNLTKEWSRVNLNVSVGYGEDLDRVITVINRVGNELAADPAWSGMIIKAPQALRVDKLGDSGVEIKILGDTKPIKQWDVMGELRKRLKKAFDAEGIEIPWPHTKVYFGGSGIPKELDKAA